MNQPSSSIKQFPIKIAETPQKEKIITLIKEMLEEAEKGNILAFAAVGFGAEDRLVEAAVTPIGTRVGMIGALNLLQHRMATCLVEEHDGKADPPEE